MASSDRGEIQIELQDGILNGNDTTKLKDKQSHVDSEINVHDRVPADITLAELHAKAKRIAKPVKDCKDICQCCGYQVDNQDISMFCEPTELSFLGPGVPLYFGFIKACSVFLIVAGVIYTIYGMILNKRGDYCITPPNGVTLPPDTCVKNLFNEYSLINRMNDETQVKHQNWVNLGVVVFLIISLHIYRRQMRQEEEYLDYELISPSDFTVQLSGLPPRFREPEVRSLLNDWWNLQSQQTKDQAGGFTVENVSIAYDVTEYMQQINERSKISLQMRKNDFFEKKNKTYPPKQPPMEELKTKRADIQKKIDDLENEVFSDNYHKTTPHCFVTFNTRKILELLVDTQHISALQRFWIRFKLIFGYKPYGILHIKRQEDDKTYIISVHRAPEPQDINWENCGATSFEKLSKRLLTWFITLVFLGVCFVLIYLINKWQYSVNQDNKNKEGDNIVRAKLILLSLFSSFAIVVINMGLTIFLRILSSLEKQPTVTHVNISVAEKLTIFCTSALITLAVNFTIDVDSFWGNGGITNDFTLIALTNCVIPPLINILNPWWFIRLSKRRTIRNDKNAQFSQGEANNWYEGSPFDFAIKYASAIKTLWMIGFYTPLSPYLPCLGIITLFLNYWVDKYCLVNRAARCLLGSDLNKEMIEMVEYFPFSIAIGNLVWMRKLGVNDRQSLILQLVAVGISAINFIVPSSKINKMLFKITQFDDSQNTGFYHKQKYRFNVDYDRCNPITKEEAIKKFYKELKDNKEIKPAQIEEFKQFILVQDPMNRNIIASDFPQNQNQFGQNQFGHQQTQSYPLNQGQSQYQQQQQQFSQIGQPQQYPPPSPHDQQPRQDIIANPLLNNDNMNVSQQPFNVVGAQAPMPPIQYQQQMPGFPQQQQYGGYQQQGGAYNQMGQYPNQLPYSNNMFAPQQSQYQQQQQGYRNQDYSNQVPHQPKYY